MAARRTTQKKKGRSRNKQAQEYAAQWSILLFGIGAFLLALTYVPGESGWSWIRTNLLFGVFGVSTYCLAPLVLYTAVCMAMRQPVMGKVGKAFLLMLLLSGAYLAFSKTEMTGYNFNDGMVFLHKSGASEWGIGGGAISAVFGWSLLALCGRPGANILVVLFMVIGIMLFTGVTPVDVYFFCTGKASRVKESLDHYSTQYADEREMRAAARALRSEEEALRAEQQAEFAATQQALALANSGRTPVDRSTFIAARAKRNAKMKGARRTAVDIDLGPEVTATTVLQSPEKPIIGPGGTFGLGALQDAMTKKAKVQEPEAEELDFGPIITRKRTPATTPQMPCNGQANPNDIATLAQKASVVVPEEIAEPVLTAPVRQNSPSGYAYPPLSLFQKQPPDDEQNVQEELAHNADLLVKTLASFGVQTRVLDINRGPSVTRYELQPLAGVKISRITGLSDDIALNLATTGVRIEAPIPGKAAVGVEIPNKIRSMVNFRSILESPEFSKQTAPLAFAVGKDIAGHSQVGNLTKMPHLLIAGTTGSGKSVCTNSIIMSFLYRCPPETLRMILIDPKMVEFAQYNGIPHLLMPVVTEPRKAAGALGSAVAEMEKRYHLLAENGVPNIEEYNALVEQDATLEKLPYVVIVIDELADLMMVAGKEVEDYICRIAQKARAAGMHLIIATQRPSVDVITGLIKANVPSRIGLSVMSQIDSRTILDMGGAEKLLGNGDMLYMPVGVNKPVRIQGTFVRSAEIKNVIEFIKKNASANYNEEMIAEMEKRAVPEKAVGGAEDDSNSQDSMFSTAVEVIIDAGQASTSLLQRRCKLGYARAARIMDEMEQAGIIGPYEGSKPRQVLMSRQQWIEMTLQRKEDSTPEVF